MLGTKRSVGVVPEVNLWEHVISVADLGGRRGRTPPPPLGTQILLISCSFRENVAKSYVGAPPGELAPPLENPGSAAEYVQE